LTSCRAFLRLARSLLTRSAPTLSNAEGPIQAPASKDKLAAAPFCER
jgi:hypothetical protein